MYFITGEKQKSQNLWPELCSLFVPVTSVNIEQAFNLLWNAQGKTLVPIFLETFKQLSVLNFKGFSGNFKK